MSEQSDSKNGNEVSAEALYRRYQQRRLSVSNELLHKSAVPPSRGEEKSGIAEGIYTLYQSRRTRKNDTSEEAAMLAHIAPTTKRLLELEDQPYASSVPDIRSVAGENSRADGTALLADIPAANSTTMFKRMVLPVIAAAILGFIIIPFVVYTPTVPSAPQVSLTAALEDNAKQAATFVDPPANTIFGFSNATDIAKENFSRGVNLLALHLLVEAQEYTAAAPFLTALMSPDSVRSATTQLGAAMSEGASKEVQMALLAELAREIEYVAGQSKQLDWFRIGHSIESIKITAEYALQYSDTLGLEQALALGAELQRPAGMPSMVTLLDELFQTELAAPEEFVQVGKILNKAKDIKLLMQ